MDGYVAPRLAWSTQLRLAVIEEGRVVGEEVRDVRDFGPGALAGLLCSLPVDTIVCGGIPPEYEWLLERRGTAVIWGVIGTTSQVLVALARGRLARDDAVNPRHANDAQLPEGTANADPPFGAMMAARADSEAIYPAA
jgi:hypothetical protein